MYRLYRRIKSFIDKSNSGQHNIPSDPPPPENTRKTIHFLPCSTEPLQPVKILKSLLQFHHLCLPLKFLYCIMSIVSIETTYIIIIHQTSNITLYRKHATTNLFYIIPSLDQECPILYPFQASRIGAYGFFTGDGCSHDQ